MKPELNQLLKFIKSYEKSIERKDDIFLGGITPTVICYLFIKRYEAIKDDLGLSPIGFKIEPKSTYNLQSFDPESDLIDPLFEYIRKHNEPHFDRTDFKYYLSSDEIYTRIFNAIDIEVDDIGLDFSPAHISIDEFDEFFDELIKFSRGDSYKDIDKRYIPNELAKMIAKNCTGSTVLTLGDDKGEIGRYLDKKKPLILSGFDKSIIWYYLRSILTGKTDVKLIDNEFKALIGLEVDAIIQFPPIATLSKTKKNQLEQQTGIKFKHSTLEGIFIDLAISNIRKTKGYLYTIVPTSFLFSSKRDYKRIRESIIKEGALKTVIRLPKGVFNHFSSISYSILEISYHQKSKEILLIDGTEIHQWIYPHKPGMQKDLFHELSIYWESRGGFDPYVCEISLSEVKKNNYSLEFSNFKNPSRNAERHLRNRDESLVSFDEILEPIRTSRPESGEKLPYASISNLIKEPPFFKLDIDDLPKIVDKKNVRKLEESALLISGIIGDVNPTFYERLNSDIYINSSLYAFSVSDVIDIQYLVFELRSEFVQEQFRRINVGVTSRIPKAFLKNVFLRIPPIEIQREIVRDQLNVLAKSKLKEVEGLSKDLKFIEKEVFASFAHNFKQILHKVALDIDTLKNYMIGLQERDIINLSSSILFEEKAPIGQSVGEVIKRLVSNQNKAEEFLQNEVSYFTQDKAEYYYRVNLKDVTLDWKKRQLCDNYQITFLNWPFGRIESDFEKEMPDIVAKTNESDFISILNNMLKNAVEHGFQKDNDNEFVICFTTEPKEGSLIPIPVMHIGNNGIPFPNDFSCNDLFKLHHKGNNSTGSGLGGYSIKRKLDRMGASIKCESSVLPKDDFPVQFEIHFKPVEFEDLDE